MKINWITVVWGDFFLELFLNMALRAQLSPGNLPGLTHRDEHRYIIYTTHSEARKAIEAPIFQRLISYITVEFYLIPKSAIDRSVAELGNPYAVMSRCHAHALEEAAREGAAVGYLAPDAIWSDGSFSTIERKVAEGYRLLLLSGLVSSIEAGRPWIERECARPDGAIMFTANDAGRLIRRYPTQMTEGRDIDSSEFIQDWPSIFLAKVNADSVVTRAWHHHPVLVVPDRQLALQGTIDDGSIIEQLMNEPGEAYLFRNSHELSVVDLRPRIKIDEAIGRPGPFSPRRIARWVLRNTNKASREMARHSVVFDGGDATTDAVEAAEAKLTEAVENVLSEARLIRIDVKPLFKLGDVDPARNVWLYGAGKLGQSLYAALSTRGEWAFSGFVDTFETGSQMGHRILAPDEFRSAHQVGDQVVIASVAIDEISPLLERLGITEALDATAWYRLGRSEATTLKEFTLTRKSIDEILAGSGLD